MPQRAVIDANVAIKWFIEEDGHDRARALLTGGDRLIGPDLVLIECVNIAWKKWRQGSLDAADVAEITQLLPDAFAVITDSREVLVSAARLSLRLNHPAYDCLYLAVAEDRGAVLVTADDRLIRAVQGTPWQGLVRPL